MLDIIGEFWEKNWLSGVEVENVLGIGGAFWEKNFFRGWGAYIAFVAHFRFKIRHFYQNLWHLLGYYRPKKSKKSHKFVAISLKNKKVHEKHVLQWNIHYFFVFFIKRILHYNRAILHWIIKKKYMKNTFCHEISVIFGIFHKTYFTL